MGNYKIEIEKSDTVFTVLERIAASNGFSIDYVSDQGYGVFITKIDSLGYDSSLGYNSPDGRYWMFYDVDNPAHFYNEGASSAKVYNKDIVEWRYEKPSW